jgi:transcriptional antiterminator RfaH
LCIFKSPLTIGDEGRFTSLEKWYVARSKPRSEELLWKQFCLRNFEAYYPCIKSSSVNPRARKWEPYFPGYIFVRVDLGLIGKSIIEWMPGGIGLVMFGDEPAFISDDMVYEIKQHIENLKTASAKNKILFYKGDHIIINNGIFAGYEGIFDIQLSGADRVRVLLSSLENQPIPVEMPTNCVQRIN